MPRRLIRGVPAGRRNSFVFMVRIFLLSVPVFFVLPSVASAKDGAYKAPIKKPSSGPAKEPASHSSVPSSSKPGTMATAIFSQMQASPNTPIDVEFEMKRLNNLLQIRDQNADAFFNRGWLHEYRGDLAMAERDYSKAIQLNGRHADAHYNRGLLYAKMKKFEQAVQDFSTTLKLEPNAADAYCNRGNANLQLGRIDLALQDYTAGLRIKPDDGDLSYNRGVVYLIKGEERKAREDFKRAALAGHPRAKASLSSAGIE